MKYLGTALVLSMLFLMTTACGSLNNSPKVTKGEFRYNGNSHKSRYVNQLEKNSKLIKAWYHYTVEEMPSGKVLVKKYFPETKQMTHRITYNTPFAQVKDGPATEWYDDGQLLYEGQYKKNKKHGEWKEYNVFGQIITRGKYKNGNKEGLWIGHNFSKFKAAKRSEYNYTNNFLDGPFKTFDETGKPKKIGVYSMGKLISEEYVGTEEANRETFEAVEEFPFLKGCENENKKLQKACSDRKMLENIYGNIKYPPLAREFGIQGSALLSFTIGKEGELLDLKVLRGLSEEISAECLRVVKDLPAWSPGRQRGKTVKVHFNLPITFRLQ